MAKKEISLKPFCDQGVLKSPKKLAEGITSSREEDDAINPLAQQLLKKAKNLEQSKKGRGRLYKTPHDRSVANHAALDNLTKAITSKRIALMDKKPLEKGKSSE